MSDDLEWRYSEQSGLRLPRLRALAERLQVDLDPDAWGYAQLGDLANVEQRAVVSDQLIASVQGVRTNLLELALSLSDYHALAGDGLRIPRPEHWTEDFERHLRVEMAQVAVFRALGSVLDCLAAVAIVVLRIPRAPTYADVRDLERLGDLAARFPEGSSARAALQTAADVHQHRLTSGLGWALEMRNAVVHRGRQIGFMLSRPDQASLAIVTSDPTAMARRRGRADVYLHRRPWLPEMEHLADSADGIQGQWINEPVQITMQALREDLVEIVDGLSDVLLFAWDGPGAAGMLPAPSEKWVVRDPPDVDFAGYAPKATFAPIGQIHVNPATAVRIEIAERLRRRRLDGT